MGVLAFHTPRRADSAEEMNLTAENYRFLQDHIHRASGIVIEEGK